MVQNLVFLQTYEHIFCHKGATERDFLIRERGKITGAIQVCWTMGRDETRKREINGLMGLILTFDEDEYLATRKDRSQ